MFNKNNNIANYCELLTQFTLVKHKSGLPKNLKTWKKLYFTTQAKNIEKPGVLNNFNMFNKISI